MSTLIDKIELAVIYIQDKLKQPYFRIGDILEIDSELSVLNRVLASQDNKFPFIYMRTDYTETEVIRGKQFESDITLFLVNRSSEKNYTAELRRDNEIPKLKTIIDKLLRALKLKGIEFEENTKTYKYYNSEENEFNTPVNIVRLELSSSNYCLT